MAPANAGSTLKPEAFLSDAFIEDAFDMIVVVDRDGLVRYANPATERVLGHPPSLLIGADIVSLIHPGDMAQVKAVLQKFRLVKSENGTHGRLMEARFSHKEGSWPVLEGVLNRVDSPALSGIAIHARDITERKYREAASTGQGRVLEMLASNAPLEEVLGALMQVVDAQPGRVRGAVLLLEQDSLSVRQGAAPGLPGVYLSELDALSIGTRLARCGNGAARRQAFVLTDIRQDALWSDYAELAARHGFPACWAAPIRSSQGVVLGVFGMHCVDARVPNAAELRLAEDTVRIAGVAVEHRRSEAMFAHMAYHDPLTGLPNRILLEDRLTQAIVHADRIKESGALLFIDIDHFKQINDAHGHHAGDFLLQEIARRLQNCMRKEDSLGRLGGDEFVLTLMAPADSRSAAQVAQKIMDALMAPVVLDGLVLQASCSIGISMFPDDGDSARILIRNADNAMYRAKAKGRGNFMYFTPDLNMLAQNRGVTATQLRDAVTRAEFSLVYQSQVALDTESVLSVEALLRWRRAGREMVPPFEFIPVAEDTGLILQIGNWVLREGCAQLKRWHDAGYADLCLSINLSPRQLLQPDFRTLVADILEETGVRPAALSLELTEEVLIFPAEEKLASLMQLKRLGVQLTLDNFGTGYSSLSDLQRLNVDTLKIDRSFIHGIGRDRKQTALTNAIIAMARELELKVVAGGIETTEQAGFLRERGCAMGQGYLFGGPVTADVITRRLLQQST